MDNFSGYSILVCQLFSFSTVKVSFHFLSACNISGKKSAVSSTGIPLCVICYFSLTAFRILSLSLILESLRMICLPIDLIGLNVNHDLWPFCNWTVVSFGSFGKLCPYFFKYFEYFFFPFGILKSLLIPNNLNICSFYVVPYSL